MVQQGDHENNVKLIGACISCSRVRARMAPCSARRGSPVTMGHPGVLPEPVYESLEDPSEDEEDCLGLSFVLL